MKLSKMLLCLLLAAAMCFAVGCGSKKNSNDDDNNDNSAVGSENSLSNNSDDENTVQGTGENIRTYREQGLVYFESFSNGYCFANIKENADAIRTRATVCVDKKGDIIFELDEAYYVDQPFNIDGIALISRDSIDYICNLKGELTSVKELGGTSIYESDSYKNQDIWDEGHIIVEKLTSDYTGTIHELAVFNSKLEKLVDYSEELYEFIESTSNYKDGYLYSSNIGWIDLNTGNITKISSEEEFVSFYSLFSDSQSDFWSVNYNGVKTPFSDEIIFDFEDKYPTFRSASEFKNGYAQIIFYNDQKVYFSVINDKFELQFEPVECLHVDPQFDGEYYLFYDQIYKNSDPVTKVVVFNNEGMVSEGELIGHSIPQLEDGIISYHPSFNIEDWHFYDINFNLLF